MPLTWALSNWKLLGLAVLLALLGLQTVRVSELQQAAAERRAVDAESQRLAERAQRTEEQRRTAAVAQEASNAQTRIASLEDDLQRARAASDGVRSAAAGAAGRARANSCPAAAGTRQHGDDALGLLVDVLGRADQRAGELAEYADRLRIAGVACERSYDALTTTQRR
ncbi:DUF2514 family protein [Variovorax atrisoli]|uniref:DUF2514 family protein n=1 Tax=Variovorax atrisoli TaxID=3394203 RepID=UPI0009B7A565|nr:DUF2514 family protein [Variovorax paradoxus]